MCTIDGKGTFHGMAILASVTPPLKNKVVSIPRGSVSLDAVTLKGRVPIYPFRISETVLSQIRYEKISQITVNNPFAFLDQLWFSS